ncbi:Clp protease N-terminal domain-containing protein [Actinoplanes sp. NPDC049316]|uniref:Clp protease N-terminal domain-containing protein n=1 Tax=Actinoplanes sp. NPDC049316 TaxID=3154727 RepID=UPI003413DD55
MSTSRTDVFPGDPGVRLMVAAAFLRGGDDEALGTNHLLIALTNLDATRGPLAAAGLTRTVALTVDDGRLGRWTSADAAGVGPDGPHDIVIADGGTPVPFTAAAAEALHRAATVRTVCTPADVLLALLEDPGNRATELLAICGIPATDLHADLAAGRTPAVRDDVEPALRHVRDRLIGRSGFRSPGWRRPMTAFAIAVRINYGRHPMQWIRLEAAEQAHRRHGGAGSAPPRHDGAESARPGQGSADSARRRHGGPDSSDILLAVAATYEVAQRLPYLVDPADPRFRGAALLQAAGVTYERLRAAGPGGHRDATGERLPRRMLTVRYPDTLALVRDLIADDASHAAGLLAVAGFDVASLRRTLS